MLSKQTKYHYTIYFCHEGCPPSQIFGLLLPISPKRRSNVVLLFSIHSRLGAEGRWHADREKKNELCCRNLRSQNQFKEHTSWVPKTHWQTLNQLLSSTLQTTLTSKVASGELMRSHHQLLHLTRDLKMVFCNADGTGGFCFFPVRMDCVHVLPLAGTQSLSCLCAAKENLLRMKNSQYGISCI